MEMDLIFLWRQLMDLLNIKIFNLKKEEKKLKMEYLELLAVELV